MAEVSVMRQGLKTWLKDECQDAGVTMIFALFDVDAAQLQGSRLIDPALRSKVASDIQNLLIGATSHMANLPLSLLTVNERQDVFNKRKEIVNLLQELERPHIHETPGLLPTINEKLYDFSQLTAKLLLEKVVECQCGKPGEEKYAPPTIKFPEDAIGWEALGNKIKSERYHRYGVHEVTFEDGLDDNVHAIKHDLPMAEFAKRWLVAQAGKLGIKEY